MILCTGKAGYFYRIFRVFSCKLRLPPFDGSDWTRSQKEFGWPMFGQLENHCARYDCSWVSFAEVGKRALVNSG